MSPPPMRPSPDVGVVIAGTGSALPEQIVTNADLEKVMDTSDEWIVQRTGVRIRRRIDRTRGESTLSLGAGALRNALAAANASARDLDMIICATMTADMPCPPTACQIAHAVDAGQAAAFDLSAACSGFVYGLNIAHDLIRVGSNKAIGVIASDCLSTLLDYSNAGRSTAIIFGDGAAAAVLRACDDPSKGLLAQSMHSEGAGWKDIFVPNCPQDFPEGIPFDPAKLRKVQMNGAGVFKFAVTTFPNVIQETLDKAKLKAADIDMFVCHQSNARILAAARERFGITEDKLYVNIDRYGNTSAASVPLCLDELIRAGRITPGMKVLFVAFGGGLTWGCSIWQM